MNHETDLHDDEDIIPRKSTRQRVVVCGVVLCALAPAVVLGFPIKGLDFGGLAKTGFAPALVVKPGCEGYGAGGVACAE